MARRQTTQTLARNTSPTRGARAGRIAKAGAPEYVAQWQESLGQRAQSVEAVASITEASINHFLARHHDYDRKRYSVEMKRTLPDGQMDRTFLLRVTAERPISVQLPPFAAAATTADEKRRRLMFEDPQGWDDLKIPTPEPKLYVPRQDKAQAEANVRVLCPSFKFHLEWPKFQAPEENWVWDPAPINLLAEALIALEQDDEGFSLRIEPTRVKFDKASRFILGREWQRFLAAQSEEDRILLANDEEKFNDLLLIAMNIAAVQFGPQLVRNVRVPIPVLAKQAITPALLDLKNNMVTLGASLSSATVAQNAERAMTAALDTLTSLMEADIDAKGGLFKLVAAPGQDLDTPPEKLVLRDPKEVAADLVRTNEYLQRLQAAPARKLTQLNEEDLRARSGGPAVPAGIGLAVNEHFLNTVIQSVMPKPVNRCTREETILSTVKGWACYWAKLYNPHVALNGTDLAGDLQVDVGGSLHGCVKKFWDCSWSWACSSLSLAVRGNPGVKLRLLRGKGVALTGQITGQLELETNLPFPFKEIVRFFSRLIWEGVKAILNVFLSMITIEIFPPKFELPEQATKLQFSQFDPFPFVRAQPATLPLQRRTFIGYTVGVTATK